MYSAEDLFTEDAGNDLDRIVEGNYDDEAIEGGDDDNQANDGAENNQGGDENDDANQAADGTQAAVKPKRTVRNPQPKFNADTLRNARGLMCLESLFNRVQFKGRGHEEQDLNVLMKTYEYWCHRMFPKFPFDDSIARLEKLGTKKPVQTYLKRIRLDMLTDSDERPELIDQPDDEVDGEDDDRFDSLLPQTESTPQSAQPWTDDQLSRLEENRKKAQLIKLEKLRKIQEKAKSAMERSQAEQTNLATSADRQNEFPDEFDEIYDRCDTQDESQMEVDTMESAQDTSEALQWSDEQLQRLEENRKRAERVRLEKQRKIEETFSKDKQDTETINLSTSEATSPCSEEFCETNKGVSANSEETVLKTSSPSSLAQECNVKSLNTEDNVTVIDSNHSEVCSQEMFDGNTEVIAQDNVDLPKDSEKMEVSEIPSSNDQETLHLLDPKATNCDVHNGFAINIFQQDSTKVNDTVTANNDNISNKDDEEIS